MPQRRVQIIQRTPESVQLCPIAFDCLTCKSQCALSQKLFSGPDFFVPNVQNNVKRFTCYSGQLPHEANVTVAASVVLNMAFRCYALPLCALFAGSLGAELAECHDAVCAVAGFAALFICQVGMARRIMHSGHQQVLLKEEI